MISIKAVRVLAVLVILAGLVSCGGGQAAQGALTVLGPWPGTTPGTEGWDFTQVLKAFTASTHIPVTYVETSAVDQVLQSEIQKGDPPDLADLSSPEDVAQYAEQGDVVPLNDLLNERQMARSYGKVWRRLEMAGTTTTYAVVVKADVKSIIWYDPEHLASPPATWSQLLADSKKWTRSGAATWCMGMASTATSGWPGTDWISDILLHQSGELAYQQWINGYLPWTSPQVTKAWRTWGDMIGPGQVYGGSISALLNGFDHAGQPMFYRSPGCYLDHDASFITVDYQTEDSLPGGGQPRPSVNYNFFQFPRIDSGGSTATLVSADFMAMFRQSPEADELINYLASERAQEIWPKIPGGGAFSVDENVPLTVYSNPEYGELDTNIAAMLTSPSSTLCFGAGDLMPEAMQTAFYQGVLEYLQNPDQLHTILSQLDNVRKDTYASHPSFTCGPA